MGGGAFLGPPSDGHAEIADFTLDPHRGRGHASFTARAIVDVARSTAPAVGLIAKTLPETGLSTRILEKAGFARVGHVADDEVGEAWLWRLFGAVQAVPTTTGSRSGQP